MNTNIQPRRSGAGLWAAIVLLALVLLLSLAVNFGLLMGGGDAYPEAKDEYPQLKEIWSYGAGAIKAIRIPVNGVIIRESEGGIWRVALDRVESILRQIRAAQNDPAVKAIILEVDSPGGSITPTDEIYRALADFRASANDRRVLVLVKGMAASGGYYIAMASDWIIAEPTAFIGSISVIIQSLNWKALSDRLGVHDVTIKSGKNKDLLNPFQEVNPEQIAMLQGIVDSLHRHFMDIVRHGRSLEEAALQEICDGRVFSAAAARQRHLIDEVGYWPDAVARTARLLGQPSIKIVRYEERPDFARWLARLHAPSFNLNLPAWLNAEGPQLMYLWRP